MNNSDDRQISLSLSLSIDLRRLSLQPTRTVSKVDDDWPEQPPVGSGVSRRVTGAGRGLAAAGGGGRGLDPDAGQWPLRESVGAATADENQPRRFGDS